MYFMESVLFCNPSEGLLFLECSSVTNAAHTFIWFISMLTPLNGVNVWPSSDVAPAYGVTGTWPYSSYAHSSQVWKQVKGEGYQQTLVWIEEVPCAPRLFHPLLAFCAILTHRQLFGWISDLEQPNAAIQYNLSPDSQMSQNCRSGSIMCARNRPCTSHMPSQLQPPLLEIWTGHHQSTKCI